MTFQKRGAGAPARGPHARVLPTSESTVPAVPGSRLPPAWRVQSPLVAALPLLTRSSLATPSQIRRRMRSPGRSMSWRCAVGEQRSGAENSGNQDGTNSPTRTYCFAQAMGRTGPCPYALSADLSEWIGSRRGGMGVGGLGNARERDARRATRAVETMMSLIVSSA